MKHIFILSFTFLLLALSHILFAQGENNRWCFGHKTGLDFNTNPPSFFQHNMRTFEGSACVSDAAGNMLFYSSGAYCWDRNGNMMPNGQGLSGNGIANAPWGNNVGSSSKGVAIFKSPSNSNQYYLLVTDAVEDASYKAYYSVIDMTLNNGLGDVIPTQKNILLVDNIEEGIVTVSAGCSGYWAIIHRKFSADYLAFKIDANGLSLNPVVSTGLYGAANTTQINNLWMTMNTQQTMIARGGDSLELASFDKNTGVLSGFSLLPGRTGFMIFSPDDTKLYTDYDDKINQFNIALLPNITAVSNSRVVLDTSSIAGMRLGPDGKIYTRTVFVNFLNVINNPNALGAACQYNPHVMTLPVYVTDFITLSYDFGNPVTINPPLDTVKGFIMDTTICFLDKLTLNSSGIYEGYSWDNGSNLAERTVTEDGQYWVMGLKNCKIHIDSFTVHFNRFDYTLGADTTICDGDELLLDATTANASYKWQDNATSPTYKIEDKGTYHVAVTVGKCTLTDTIDVAVVTPFVDIIESDTLLCEGVPFTLHANAVPEGSFLWSDNTITNQTTINTGGIYTVTTNNACGTFSDSVSIETQLCYCNAFVPNAFTPNGDGSNDMLEVKLNCPGMSGYKMTIYNRFGERIFESSIVDNNWDGYRNGRAADVGVYFYYIEYKDNTGKEIKKKGDILLFR